MTKKMILVKMTGKMKLVNHKNDTWQNDVIQYSTWQNDTRANDNGHNDTWQTKMSWLSYTSGELFSP